MTHKLTLFFMLLLICFSSSSLFAEEPPVQVTLSNCSSQEYITVSGTVYDKEDASPIIGISIVIKGTTNGTITDFDGRFSIKVKSETDVLVFSFIGYEAKEITAKEVIANPRIELETSEIGIEEVVAVGYGTTRRSRHSKGHRHPHRSHSVKKRRVKIRGAAPISRSSYVAPVPVVQSDSYGSFKENSFLSSQDEPLSTFSVDVDAASYSNVRGILNRNQKPPVDAVRIEEMINYFDYTYEDPSDETPFSINSELGVCPWNEEHYLLHVGLQGKKMYSEDLPASNIVFLIDVSGSMDGADKLELLKKGFRLLVNELREKDHVAIVTYSGRVEEALPSTSCREKKKILEALDGLYASGSTAGGEALKMAYDIAQKNYKKRGNNRIVMATDGDFNIGVSSNKEMEKIVSENREKGISISVLGFGYNNLQDDKLEIIADKGNGNYSYIDNLLEAKKVLVNQFGGTFHTIAKDVKFQLEFNPKYIAEYRLIGYENRMLEEEDFEDDKKDAGEIGAGHTVTALYELIPASKAKKDRKLKYQTSELSEVGEASGELVNLKLRYKKPNGSKSDLVEQPIYMSALESTELSNNFRFSAAVAEFGMLLRGSEHKGDANWKELRSLATNAKGKDLNGYRGEFVRLIEMAELLDGE